MSSVPPMLGEAAQRLHGVTGWRWPLLLAVMLSGPPLMALTFSSIAPVLPSIGQHFARYSDGATFAQWVMTAPAIGLMIGAPLGGTLLDRMGPRLLIIGALALFAIAGSAGLYLDDPVALLLSRFLLGLAGSTVAAIATWLIGERFEDARRRRMLGIQDSIAGIAAMSAVLLSGVAGAAGGWRLPFAIYLVAAPLVLFGILSVPRVTRKPVAKEEPAFRSVVMPLWSVYIIILGMGGLMMLPATQVPFLLENNGITNPVIRAQVIASSAALTIASAGFYGWIREKLGEHNTLLLVLSAYMLGTFLLSQSHTALGAALGCMFLGIGTGIFTPHFSSVMIARNDPALRGRAIGIMYGTIFLSEFLSPLVILPLRAAFGVHGSFLALAAALFFGILGSFFAARRNRTTHA